MFTNYELKQRLRCTSSNGFIDKGVMVEIVSIFADGQTFIIKTLDGIRNKTVKVHKYFVWTNFEGK